MKIIGNNLHRVARLVRSKHIVEVAFPIVFELLLTSAAKDEKITHPDLNLGMSSLKASLGEKPGRR